MPPSTEPIPFLSTEPSSAPLLNEGGGSIWPMAAGLIVFFAFLFLCYFLLRRLSGFKTGGGAIQIIESKAVGRNAYLCVARLGSRVFALCITKDGAKLLCELDSADFSAAAPVPATAAAGGIMQSILKRKDNESESRPPQEQPEVKAAPAESTEPASSFANLFVSKAETVAEPPGKTEPRSNRAAERDARSILEELRVEGLQAGQLKSVSPKAAARSYAAAVKTSQPRGTTTEEEAYFEAGPQDTGTLDELLGKVKDRAGRYKQNGK